MQSRLIHIGNVVGILFCFILVTLALNFIYHIDRSPYFRYLSAEKPCTENSWHHIILAALEVESNTGAAVKVWGLAASYISLTQRG